MIEVRALSKSYGRTAAVSNLSFTVRPGCVTGFLGPNGSGKSTTMRLILGLDRPTSGEALIGGVSYRQLRSPMRQVGALIDARAVQGGRRASDHLSALARSNRIPRRRMGEVLAQVGLSDVARQRIGGFSLGMSQRLGIAAALLGDPAVLIFDEPINGLDTEGIRWVRLLVKQLAAEGRTVLVSSHLMSEMELTADRLVVIGDGRLLADTTVSDLVARHSGSGVVVRTPHPGRLGLVVDGAGGTMESCADGSLRVSGINADSLGDLALAAGVALHELSPVHSSLEDVYTELVRDAVMYRSTSSPRSADEHEAVA